MVSSSTALSAAVDVDHVKSMHVLTFSSHGDLLVAESEGVFDVDTWEAVFDAAKMVCCSSSSHLHLHRRIDGDGGDGDGGGHVPVHVDDGRLDTGNDADEMDMDGKKLDAGNLEDSLRRIVQSHVSRLQHWRDDHGG